MKIYLVGGAVRDKLLGVPASAIKERDYVVVGATVADMLALGYRQVGKEFPVFLHPKTNEEYALARMERKTRPGYQGFSFDTSPTVTLEDDLLRRDLTINAMAETQDGELFDPYNGKADLAAKVLRHVSPAFAEDPVRILRVGRFLARLADKGFTVAPETFELMRQMVTAGEVDALVAERVWKELERALSEPRPECFFQVLAECGALPVLFPHLAMDGPGMAALGTAKAISNATTVRFAALLYAQTNEDIATICNRYRVPNAYRELARLTALHYETALRATTIEAFELLKLFNSLDIYRRKDRFKDFLKTCEVIAHAYDIKFNSAWLNEAADVAEDVDVQALIAQGYQGGELAVALKHRREEQIKAWLKLNPPR